MDRGRAILAGNARNPDQHMAGRGEFHRIPGQIDQHLPDPPRIAHKLRVEEQIAI